jgi:hypothetical protein
LLAEVSNVPAVTVRAAVAPVEVQLLPKVQPPPVPLTVNRLPIVTPLDVIVFPVDVPTRVIVPVLLHVVPELSVKFPTKDKVPVEAKVHPVTLTDRLFAFKAPVMVMVPGVPELPSNVTASCTVGTGAPLAPPEENAQFVWLLVLQVPAPPTQ